jgi:hypothetical protein
MSDQDALLDFGTSPEVYSDGLDREDNGVTTRLVWYARRKIDGRSRRVVALTVVVPTSELRALASALCSPVKVANDGDNVVGLH